MATKVEMMEKYTAQLEELGETVNAELLEWATDRVGPANYNRDAQTVAASDPEEVKRVYTNFVADELEETDEEKGMKCIDEVLETMKPCGSNKYRAVCYYLLSKKYGK